MSLGLPRRIGLVSRFCLSKRTRWRPWGIGPASWEYLDWALSGESPSASVGRSAVTRLLSYRRAETLRQHAPIDSICLDLLKSRDGDGDGFPDLRCGSD